MWIDPRALRALRGFFSSRSLSCEKNITDKRIAFRDGVNMGKPAAKRAREEPYIYNVNLPKKAPKKGQKRQKPQPPKYLTEDERQNLFKAVRAGGSARDMALFGVMFYHGMRASEPGTLKLSDYVRGPSLSYDRLFLRRKKGSISTDVVLVPACAQLMRSWIRVRGPRPGPLFITREKTGIGRGRVFALMVRYGRAAGLPPHKLHPHVLKHSCAVDLANYQKESILDIRSHLGHSSINSTMIYTQLLDQSGEERARRLAEWR